MKSDRRPASTRAVLRKRSGLRLWAPALALAVLVVVLPTCLILVFDVRGAVIRAWETAMWPGVMVPALVHMNYHSPLPLITVVAVEIPVYALGMYLLFRTCKWLRSRK